MPEPEESVTIGESQPETPAANAVAETAVAEVGDVEPRVEPPADDVLLASAALAQRALLEVTAPESVGSVIGHVVEGEHVLTLLFAADLSGYPGWHWSVTLARVEGAEPTVLETELMPGDRALLAPEWVPWSERLAEYRAAQAAAQQAAAGDDAVDVDDADLDDDFDDDEFDEGTDPADADEGDGFDETDDDDADFDHDDDADEFDGIDIDVLDESDDPFEVGEPVEVDDSEVDDSEVDDSEVDEHDAAAGAERRGQSELDAGPDASGDTGASGD